MSTPSVHAVDLVCETPTGQDDPGPGPVAGVLVPPTIVWRPAPGWDPMIATLTDLDRGWTGLVRYVPASAEGLAGWVTAPVAAALGAADQPLVVWWRHRAPCPLERVFALAEAHPALTVVLAADVDPPADLLACLLAAVPRLLLATTGLRPETLRAAIDAVGAERLVFGSGRPPGASAAALGAIEALELSPPERHRVVAGTALSLLHPGPAR